MSSLFDDSYMGVLVAQNPKATFFGIHNLLKDEIEYAGSDKKTVIGKNCSISSLAYIAENNVTIGNNVVIEEFVSIKGKTSIGDNCIIRSNTVIGGKSFAFAKTNSDTVQGLKDLGEIKIGLNVEIFSMSHIAQGTLPLDCTILGDGTKVDALVHIGHGTQIGKQTFIPAGAQISGNVKIGNQVWIGVNATIANRLKIGNNARVSLGSVVTKNVEEGKVVTGNFAIDHTKFIANLKKGI